MPRERILILLSIPIIAIPISYLLTTHPSSPLSSPTTTITNYKRIQETRTIPSSFANSRTLRQYVNPQNFTHNALRDTRTIHLTRKEVEGLSDEELLARFTRGFFGGWVFFVEKCGLSLLARLGWRAAGPAGTGFVGIPTDGRELSSFPMELSRSSLPPKYARLAGGNFMVIDFSIRSDSEEKKSMLSEVKTKPNADEKQDGEEAEEVGSFIDIAFGDNRNAFAGCHRFEVLRSRDDEDGEDGGGVRIVYPGIACNPTVEEATFPWWLGGLHMIYARLLFWDGIREVLS